MDKLGDEEKGEVPRISVDYAATKEPVREPPKLSHYSIVNRMVNYHAVDFGDKCKTAPPHNPGCAAHHIPSHLRRSELDASSEINSADGCCEHLGRRREAAPAIFMANIL
jgi:hypothetical protein